MAAAPASHDLPPGAIARIGAPAPAERRAVAASADLVAVTRQCSIEVFPLAGGAPHRTFRLTRGPTRAPTKWEFDPPCPLNACA
jgi:hypothetical protein